ncbi:MAG TPA: beta-galactosidase, partial [Chthonomonadales bacterium]|nr:beta-galactosidase [Chthonomonadales bacterium]
MHFGAAWYPEHWPEERWPEDVRLMKEAGFTVCRVAEFAWSTMEPTEGQYQFAWLERAIAMAADAGLDVVLGTPTAAPPAWLTYHHPDTVAIEANGRAAQHGNRCHYSPTSSTYHKYARRIAEQMAKRFGPDERVMAWQIDNEYSRIDYSENSRRQFQAYLKEQFGSLDELNKHWSTAYWSQTYGDWNEIPIPVGGHNPGLMLEFKRFVSRVWRDFQKTQIDAIRQYARPEQWITHNFMGWFDGFDHYVVAKDLDLASWDWYVAAGHHDYANSGAMHDLIRGLKRKNFW